MQKRVQYLRFLDRKDNNFKIICRDKTDDPQMIVENYDSQIEEEGSIVRDELEEIRFSNELNFLGVIKHSNFEDQNVSLGSNQNNIVFIQKEECFNAVILERVLENLRLEITTTLNSEEKYTKSLNLFMKLRHYGLSADMNSGRCRVTYSTSPSDVLFGRVYGYTQSLHSNAKKYSGLQNFPKWVRAALCSQFYWDLDVINAHPCILLGILTRLNEGITQGRFGVLSKTKTTHAKQQQSIQNPLYFQTAQLTAFVKSRDALLLEIIDKYELQKINPKDPRSLAKELVTSLFFGGTVNSWQERYHIVGQPVAVSQEQQQIVFLSMDITKLSAEIRDASSKLWQSDELLAQIGYYTINLKLYLKKKYSNSIAKQHRAFLSLLLQTEERRLLSFIECFFIKNHREMDTYIHDGGLIRKLVKRPNDKKDYRQHLISMSTDKNHNADISEWKRFDAKAYSKREIEFLEWEPEFPAHLLQHCEDFLSRLSVNYTYIRLAIKPFSSSWTEQLKFPNLPIRPYLRKSFDELMFFYEVHKNLSQLTSTSEYFFDGELYTEDKLKSALPEKLYYMDIFQDEHVKLLLLTHSYKTPAKKSGSDHEGMTTPLRSPSQSSGGDNNSATKDTILLPPPSPQHSSESLSSVTHPTPITSKKKAIGNEQLFWNKYSNYRDRKKYKAIIFCVEELNHKGLLKTPLSQRYKDKWSQEEYLMSYSGHESFDVLAQHEAVGSDNFRLTLSSIDDLELFLAKYKEFDQQTNNHWGGRGDNNLLIDNNDFDVDFITFQKDNGWLTTIPVPVIDGTPTDIPLFNFNLFSYSSMVWKDDKYVKLFSTVLNHYWLLTGRDEKAFTFLIMMFASILQEPTQMKGGGGLGVALYSEIEGSGKSIAAKMILDLVAPFGKETHDIKSVFGRFGTLQENAFLIHIEDADASETKQYAPYFKNRLTATTMKVEKKFQNEEQRLNLCRYIITTNTLNMFKLTEQDRRWSIIKCENLMVKNKSYFHYLLRHWNMPLTKYATFLFLMCLDISKFNPESERPKTEVYQQVIRKDMCSIKRFLIKLSLWMKRNVYSLPRSMEGHNFQQTMSTKISKNNETACIQKYGKDILFWITSQNFYSIYVKFQSTEPDGKIEIQDNFSRRVRELSEGTAAKVTTDFRKIACLPVMVDQWCRQAKQEFGMTYEDDCLDIESLLTKHYSSLSQNEVRLLHE